MVSLEFLNVFLALCNKFLVVLTDTCLHTKKQTIRVVIKEGLAEFASLLVDGTQKAQIEHYLSSI